MSLTNFLRQLEELESEASQALRSVADSKQLEAIRVRFLGAKNGMLKEVQKLLGSVDGSDKPAAGKRLNEVKQALTSAFESAKQTVEGQGLSPAGDGPRPDPTMPGKKLTIGHLHPVTQTIEHLKEIMGRMGFTTAEGPEVEDPWHNFVALNIPEDHPARDPLDNFYLSDGRAAADDRDAPAKLDQFYGAVAQAPGEGARLLRSQTSTVQIRVMEATRPPIRIISLGRVYRPDAPDATHYPMFHQMEGLLVDTDVTMANLKTVLRIFANNYLGGDVEIRFRPSFFPFTEPSVEVDFLWNDHWIEFGGAGMVDPAVLSAVGYDPETYSGFAFGLGVERLCMRRHGITDIRDLFSGDLRLLNQF